MIRIFVFHIKQWQNSGDAILSDLSRRFISRRMFKAIDLDMPQDQQAEFLVTARQTVARAGFDPDYYFIEDRASDVPYYGYYETEKSEPKTHIYVESGYASPQIREISEVSDVVKGTTTRVRVASRVLSRGREERGLRAIPSWHLT
jgi:HD superfamily phosphohydrolase